MKYRYLYRVLITVIYGSSLVLASSAPGNEASCEKNASTLATEGKLDEGIAAIKLCLAENPSQAKAHVILGTLLFKKGDSQQAMASFNTALELQPRSSAAKTGKGVILAQAGDLKTAESILREALELNPNPARTHYELGLIYERLGDTKEALAQFKKGIISFEQRTR
ncbi:MAG: hypothetical protein BWK76_11760 [Desulfobulbaceae bacterium A2]|nr:MAG: hypothetical protein BWK76_11760 [Desulfobulbaceae bacterium A2]